MAVTNKHYVKSIKLNRCECPFCQSDQLEWDELTVDGNTVKQEVWCNSCKKEWYDVYNLKGYVER
jgi:transposase-like protein